MVEVGGIDNLDGEGTDDSSRGGTDDLTKGHGQLGWGGAQMTGMKRAQTTQLD